MAISSNQSQSVAIKREPGSKIAPMATTRAERAERAPCVCVCACSQDLEARQLAAAIAASLAISSPVPPPPPPSQSEAEKQAALERLLQVTVPVHLISTPFSVRAGFDKARETKEDNHNPPHSYCYNPNTDSPQDAGGGWLQSWIKVCKRTKQTNGTVYVVFNRRKNGNYGDGKYKGWFDGQAQGGEVELAETLGCTISWVGYNP